MSAYGDQCRSSCRPRYSRPDTEYHAFDRAAWLGGQWRRARGPSSSSTRTIPGGAISYVARWDDNSPAASQDLHWAGRGGYLKSTIRAAAVDGAVAPEGRLPLFPGTGDRWYGLRGRFFPWLIAAEGLP